MNVRLAKKEDAAIIHKIMIEAFSEYNETIPSSALNETVYSIASSIDDKEEQAAICFENDHPIAMVRFQIVNESLYFYRLSVLPIHQGKGVAKTLLRWLEVFARDHSCNRIWCKVRKSVSKNRKMYCSLGYKTIDEFNITVKDGFTLQVISMEKIVNKVKEERF